MSISKLKASLAEATSELTFAAANLNLDFSLFKFEAPATYQPFGNALSVSRRDEAEHGKIHITARKLGQLFDHALPSIPKLEGAYGTRVSEILDLTTKEEEEEEEEGISIKNPRKSLEKLFHGQLGADGTTIWAAATSGPGALAVHLLACMLARTWAGPKATSIWVEIVEERRKEIVAAFDRKDNNTHIHYPSLNVAQHDITRDSLAQWDASARAWLGAADATVKKKIDRLRVTIADLNLPVIDDTTAPYQSVMKAWKSAMTTMENLLNGQPQTVYNGASLVGLSAWHIFPDLVVFSEASEEICNEDALVPPGGVLTIGLQYKNDTVDNNTSGVHWSLSLAHLRYYGAPVKTSSNLEQNNLRIYFDEFACTALGAFTSILGCTPPQAANWFNACLEQISNYRETDTYSFSKPNQDMKTKVQDYLDGHGFWLKTFAQASSMMLEGDATERRSSAMLSKYGQRHGSKFFCRSSDAFGHLFGICNPQVLIQLLPTTSLRVEVLRTMVDRLYPSTGGGDLIIRYRANQAIDGVRVTNDSHHVAWEFATTVPEMWEADPSAADGKTRFSHKRWLQIDVTNPSDLCPCISSCLDCQCGKKWTVTCHLGGKQDQPNPHKEATSNYFQQWKNYIEELGEFGEIVIDPWTANKIRKKGMSIDEETCFLFSREPGSRPLRYELVAGDPKRAAIYTPSYRIEASQRQQRRPATSQAPSAVDYLDVIKIDDITQWIRTDSISAHRIIAILRQLDETAAGPQSKKEESSRQLFTSLRAIGLASKVYKMLPSATVAVKTISLPLYASQWVPSGFHLRDTNSKTLSRPQTFACVAMFESGHMDIDPALLNRVFAMSSLDSIYVTSSLLCDPVEEPKDFELLRVMGNVGRAGMAMFIPPEVPEIRKDSWNMVEHLDFDGSIIDSFNRTSMHLDFSGYKLPLVVTSHGLVDIEVYLLEAVVRVRDSGNWVADLDVLKVLEAEERMINRYSIPTTCNHAKSGKGVSWATSIDTWQELLEPPFKLGVVRAHGNWLARLALTCVAAHQGHKVHLFARSTCWECSLPHELIVQSSATQQDAEETGSRYDSITSRKRPTSAVQGTVEFADDLDTNDSILPANKKQKREELTENSSENDILLDEQRPTTQAFLNEKFDAAAMANGELDEDDVLPIPSMYVPASSRRLMASSVSTSIVII